MGFDDFFFDATFSNNKITNQDIDTIILYLKDEFGNDDIPLKFYSKVYTFFEFVKSCNSKALRQILFKIFYNFMYTQSPDSTNPRRQKARDSKNRQLERVNQYFKQLLKKNKSGDLSLRQGEILSECWYFINYFENEMLYTYKKMANGKAIKIKKIIKDFEPFGLEFGTRVQNGHIW